MQNRFCLTVLMAIIMTVASEKAIIGDIFSESRSLALDSQGKLNHHHKCQREIPAIFFQSNKNEQVRGNGSSIYFHRIEVCCAGWIRSPYNWEHCMPDCSEVSSNNCHNGFCRAPNQCECFAEFVWNDRGECVHACPIGCENGRCYLNGTCACNRGYILDPHTRKFCRPICQKACGTNQECVSPGKCACKEGYRLTEELGCQPLCTPDCGHGKCVGPNQCECFSGYMKRPNRNVCEAECYINCDNGFCESRYNCQCWDGYKYDQNTTSCLPDCGTDCPNGVCVAPGVCRCFDGYKHNGRSCEAICEGGCGYYGKCVEPGICGCGSQNRPCVLGYCDSIGRCVCPPKLTRFIDKCIEPRSLETIAGLSYDGREAYEAGLRFEFEAIIGRFFHYLQNT